MGLKVQVTNRLPLRNAARAALKGGIDVFL